MAEVKKAVKKAVKNSGKKTTPKAGKKTTSEKLIRRRRNFAWNTVSMRVTALLQP